MKKKWLVVLMVLSFAGALQSEDKKELSHDRGYCSGYCAGYAAQAECDCCDEIEELFLPIPSDGMPRPEVAPPSRITIFFRYIGIELLFAYCKVQAWLAKQCGSVSVD